MYLAKFFHRPPGDADRLLLLAVDHDRLFGIAIRDPTGRERQLRALMPPEDGQPEDLFSQSFDTVQDSIAAFRREAEALRAAGYVETHHTDHTLRAFAGDVAPKPDWQRLLDEAMMSALADPPDAEAERLAALAGTQAAEEPLGLYLAADHAGAVEAQDALERAERAREALERRRASGTPSYTWSLGYGWVEGNIYELLARRHLAADAPDAEAALAAAETAIDIGSDQTRLLIWALILCTFFLEREEDAFDRIHPMAAFPIFEPITERASFAAYAEAREADARAGRGTWRWAGGGRPAGEPAIKAAERTLGVSFPKLYRNFLRKRGACDFHARLPEAHAVLRFAGPEDLHREREEFIRFVSRVNGEERAAEAFRETYGVSLRHLVPIAAPRDASNLLLLHAEAGQTYGHCYVWNHDGSWELENDQPSFEAMLATLMIGVELQEAEALDLFNIYREPE